MSQQDMTEFAQALRKSMTKEERHLWYDFLKNLSPPFRRQKVFGRYVVDFYCPKEHLVVELDGFQHFDEDGQAYDHDRDAWLERQGLKVLRYSNRDVNQNFQGVCEDILLHIHQTPAGKEK